MPDTLFKAVVKVPPTPMSTGGRRRSRTGLNVGAVVMLPGGYTLAPRIASATNSKETEGIYYTQYSDDQPNILLVGPLPGDDHQEIVFPILAPIRGPIPPSATARPSSTSVETAAAARSIPLVRRATTPSTPPAWRVTSPPLPAAMPVPPS